MEIKLLGKLFCRSSDQSLFSFYFRTCNVHNVYNIMHFFSMRCNVYWRQNVKENRRYFFYLISLKCESCTRKIWLVSTCTLIFVQGFRYVYVRNYFISLKFFSINNWLFFFCCYKINWLTNLGKLYYLRTIFVSYSCIFNLNSPLRFPWEMFV